MFKTPKDFQYEDLATMAPNKEYKINTNDNLEVQLSPNKGALIIEGAGESVMNNGFRSFNSIVDFDGTIKVPILGRVYVKDLSVRDTELLLEERFKHTYVDPYVNVRITNKRVILFTGESGMARVVPLQNANTNLLEVLAAAGGIPYNGKANKVKLIRGDLKNPKVYLIDLSTIEGMKKAELTMQGNDIVYVQPRNDYVQNFFNRATPYLAILNALLIYRVFIN